MADDFPVDSLIQHIPPGAAIVSAGLDRDGIRQPCYAARLRNPLIRQERAMRRRLVLRDYAAELDCELPSNRCWSS